MTIQPRRRREKTKPTEVKITDTAAKSRNATLHVAVAGVVLLAAGPSRALR